MKKSHAKRAIFESFMLKAHAVNATTVATSVGAGNGGTLFSD